MNLYRPGFYRRVRLFCELRIWDVAAATGVSPSRVQEIETGRRTPNDIERRLIESYLRDRLRMVLGAEGPLPSWLSRSDGALAESGVRR